MLFDITLMIEPGQLYCAHCSKTIKAYIETYFKEKKCDAIGVYPDYRNNKVDIEGLPASDRTSVEILINDLKGKMTDQIGNDCISYTIATIDDIIPEDASIRESDIFAREKLFATLSATLGGGVALMVLEHMGLLPTNVSLKGKLTNAGIGIVATVLTGFVGKDHFKNAWRAHGAMDTLISVGSASAIIYSFSSIAFPAFFDDEDSSTFFSVPLVVLGFLKLSHAIRDYVQDHINAQMVLLDIHKKKLSKTAQVYGVPGEESELFTIGYSENTIVDLKKLDLTVPVSQVRKGSIIRVSKGEIVPIDGVLLNNRSIAVHEAFYGKKGLTTKAKGSLLYAGTLNTEEDYIFLETDCEAQDSYLRKACANVKKEVSGHTILELTSRYFLWGTMITATASAFFWFFLGPKPALSHALRVFLSMLLSVCPCGLGLVEMNASMIKTRAFKEGILIQHNAMLYVSKANTVVFDKCGTLTLGKYEYERFVKLTDDSTFNEEKYLAYIVSLEQQIPENYRTAVAKAILTMGLTHALPYYTCSEFQENAMNKGAGGKAIINGDNVVFGNKGLLKSHQIAIDDQYLKAETDWALRGYLPIFFAVNHAVQGLLILKSAEEEEQELRSGVDWAIQWLIHHRKTVHIATGDTAERTHFLLQKLSNNQKDKVAIWSRQTPRDKADRIQTLQDNGNDVFYIGDDENDRPVMEMAKYSAAIGALAPVCDEAGAILNESLVDVVILMALSDIYQKSYHASLVLTFGVNGMALLLSAGVLYPVTHAFVSPMITGMMMGASSLLLMLCIALFQWKASNEIQSIRVQNEEVKAKNNSTCWQFDCFKALPQKSIETPLLDDSMDRDESRPSTIEIV